MFGGEIAMLAWSDYVGVTRCRAVPAADISRRMAHGLGWAVAGQALTPFEDIAPNPWGPMEEVRQIPDPETITRVDIWPDAPALHLYLCDSRSSDGTPWDCCVRNFLRSALQDLRTETGLELNAAFEHEFTLVTDDLPWAAPFSVAALRSIAPLTADLAEALIAAGVHPETIEPEYGLGQFEVTTGPAVGVAAGDRAVITREIIREVARRRGHRVTFSPKPTPDSVGNGAHVHFSLLDEDGQNATYDPAGHGGTSLIAGQFIAGVMRHMRAMSALVAPSPVSYLRLGPHHWSCGFASFGIQNREAAIRVCPSSDTDQDGRRRAFNLEFRPPDPTASPYMVLGALVRAGLAGIREQLPLPPVCSVDPADLPEHERQALGIEPLPSSLTEAVQLMIADETVSTWLPSRMLESYIAVKQAEVNRADAMTAEDLCEAYSRAY